MANNLKELRLKENMLQREIAEMLSIPSKRYQMYESGIRKPPVEIILKMCSLFMCNIDDIFFDN